MLGSASHNKKKDRTIFWSKKKKWGRTYPFHPFIQVWRNEWLCCKVQFGETERCWPSILFFSLPLKISILFIFGLNVRHAFLDHSTLRDIDTVTFGKICYSHERHFSGKIWKFYWYNGMESESFIFGWLTFEIAKYSLWAALTNHITPNICGGLIEMSNYNIKPTISQLRQTTVKTRCKNSLKLGLKEHKVYDLWRLYIHHISFAYLLVYQKNTWILWTLAENAMIFDIVCNDPVQRFIEKKVSKDYNHCNHNTVSFVGSTMR